MQRATLCILVDEDTAGGRQYKNLTLGLKKIGFGRGKYNGFGGKIKHGETIEKAMLRELKEEAGVTGWRYRKVGVLTFKFDKNPDWNQIVHIYICDSWDPSVKETEEMIPYRFPMKEIPYDSMWVDDKIWLPLVLKGGFVRGIFTFNDQKTLSSIRLTVK